ncbi:hypothetical protein [Kineosporia sp. R_H_3]|uniref:hypothetical protein n=1 Tax=Kineosporia sp. R_H_3 TaxID=1961848 RepID=UPI000B4B4CF3|nr:hypothetical protein [Kineosporia sp. R_H_3]
MIVVLGLGLAAVLIGAGVLVGAVRRWTADPAERPRTATSFALGLFIVVAGSFLTVLGWLGTRLGSGD